MAFLIPDNLRSSKAVPKAHRRVAAALAPGLDDAVTVWYEPPYDPSGERPHFVILDPSLGLIVVQVIDQVEDRPDEVLGAWQRAVRVLRGGSEEEIPDPLASARRFAETLAAQVAGDPALAGVPVCAIAALPYLTRAQAEERELGTVFDLDQSLCRDAVDQATTDEQVLPRIFTRVVGGVLDDDLDEQAIARLRSIVHPAVRIDSAVAPRAEGALFDAASTDEADVVKVMDRQQERLAKTLGSGHRVIRGVAGSGKTLILVHRARTLATLLPGKRILVTCYTKALASQLADNLADLPNVEVKNLDRLMLKAVRDAGMLKPGQRIDWDRLPADALAAVQQRAPQRYRAVMVDEAQDFETAALQFCVELLDAEDGAEGDLVIVADSAQNIFRKNFRWKDAGINASGRTRVLRVNYRNTKPILAFAYRFLTAGQQADASEIDLDDEAAIIPAESSERDGPEPTVVSVSDVDTEVSAVIEQVRTWYRSDLRPRSIAVLLTSSDGARRGQRIVEGLRAVGISPFWTHEDQDSKDKIGAADDVVVVSTIHSAKGLEFSKVVVAGLAHPGYDDLRKLLYVAFTRAVDELTVVVDRHSPYASDLSTTLDA